MFNVFLAFAVLSSPSFSHEPDMCERVAVAPVRGPNWHLEIEQHKWEIDLGWVHYMDRANRFGGIEETMQASALIDRAIIHRPTYEQLARNANLRGLPLDHLGALTFAYLMQRKPVRDHSLHYQLLRQMAERQYGESQGLVVLADFAREHFGASRPSQWVDEAHADIEAMLAGRFTASRLRDHYTQLLVGTGQVAGSDLEPFAAADVRAFEVLFRLIESKVETQRAIQIAQEAATGKYDWVALLSLFRMRMEQHLSPHLSPLASLTLDEVLQVASVLHRDRTTWQTFSILVLDTNYKAHTFGRPASLSHLLEIAHDIDTGLYNLDFVLNFFRLGSYFSDEACQRLDAWYQLQDRAGLVDGFFAELTAKHITPELIRRFARGELNWDRYRAAFEAASQPVTRRRGVWIVRWTTDDGMPAPSYYDLVARAHVAGLKAAQN